MSQNEGLKTIGWYKQYIFDFSIIKKNRHMWPTNTALFASLLMFVSCSRRQLTDDSNTSQLEAPKPVNLTPYLADVKKSAAFLTKHHVIIYFVADSNSVIEVFLPVSEEYQGTISVPIDEKYKVSAVLHTGPDVVKHVLPSGAIAMPPVDGVKYSHLKAVAGFVEYNCITPKGKSLSKCKVILSLDQIDFGDGTLYSIKEKAFDAWPPPP